MADNFARNNVMPSYSYADVGNYSPGSTREIMSILDGMEKTLKTTQRLENLVRNKASTLIGTEGLRNKTNHAVHYREKRLTDDQHPEVRLPGILKHRRAEGEEYPNETNYQADQHTENQSYFTEDQPEIPLRGILRHRRVSNIQLHSGDDYKAPKGPKTKRRYSVPRENQKGSISHEDFTSSQPEVKWHYGSQNFLPKNISKIGYTKTGTPLYAGRTWDDEKTCVIPAYVDFDEGKCYFGKDGMLWTSDIYEIMECKTLAWDDAKGTPVTELPKFAYKVGYNEKGEPLYFGRAFIDGAVTPGYVEQVELEDSSNQRAYALTIPFRGNILRIFDTYEIMIVLPL